MAVRIRWHRQWANFPISGLCEKDNTPYWFEWNASTKLYQAYALDEDTLGRLDQELEELVASYGRVIFHDDRYLPELPNGGGPVATVVSVADIDLSQVAFSFDSSQISNPVPHQEYYAAKRQTT